MSPAIVIAILGILFVATIIKSILGFGESMFAIPLLTLVIGIQVAAPLLAVIVAGLTLLMIGHNWQTIDLRAIWRISLAAIVGVPVGVWGLKTLPSEPITLGLGIVLILMGIYYLRRPQITATQNPIWAYILGFLSGALGGAYNMAGAPIIIYGAMQQWQSTDFRGTLQGYFIITSIVILINHAVSGLLTVQVMQLATLAIPVILLGFWVGTYMAERIHGDRFARILYVALLILGATLIVQNI